MTGHPIAGVHYSHDATDGLFVTQAGEDAGFTLEQVREADERRQRDRPVPADPEDLA